MKKEVRGFLKTSKRSVLTRAALLLAILFLQACAGFGPGGPSKPPNIILFLVDDLRWDEVGYGGSPVSTPGIDQLALDGIRFENAFVTSSLCSPSRASFLTGMYPHTHGVVGNTTDIDFDTMPTIGSLLQESGYRTAMIGKWHMGKNSAPRPGFDYWYALPGQGQYMNPQFNDNGQKIQVDGYNTDILTDTTLAFLKEQGDQPFYLHLSYKAVHGPFKPSPKYQDTLNREMFEPLKRPNAKRTASKLRKLRAEALQSVDDSVLAVYEYLKDNDMLDNTILVFTSDNGYLFGEHGRGDKRVFFEESIRIPWVVHYPRLTSRIDSIDEHILNIDFLPSILDFAGVDIPDAMQGRSFAPLLQRNRRAARKLAENWRDHWVYEYINEEQFPHVPTHLAVVTPEHKYVHFPEGQGVVQYFTGEDLLFDLKADPYEMTNVANSPGYEIQLETMRGQLADFMEDYDFQFYPLDEERINKRIKFLYRQDEAIWLKRALDRLYPEGFPEWVSPHSQYEDRLEGSPSAEE
ncbi:MAG: sulfatase-like hydrolase/transferase, partial [Pseudomonadales bacterium]